MTEEERQAEFQRRREASQQAYDAQIAANAQTAEPPLATMTRGDIVSSETPDIPPQYEQANGSYAPGPAPQGFQTGEPPAGQPVSLTSPYAFDQTSGGTPAPSPSAAPAAYQGQAFPGVPVIQEGGYFYAGGNNGYGGQGGNQFNTEAEAMAARARNAATDTQGQQLFRQQQEAAANTKPEAEPTSIQIRAEMDRNQLSPAQRLELTQMQNGIARLQRDTREGRVPALQAAQLEAGLQRRMAPMMATMQQLHGLQAAYQVAHLRETVMHQTQARTDADTYRAANPAGSQRSVRDATGRELGVMSIGADLREHFVPAREDPAIARTAREEASTAAATERADAARLHHISQSVMGIRSEVQHELTQWRDPINAPNAPEWTKTPRGIAEERQRRIDEVHSEANRVFQAATSGVSTSATTTPAAGQGGGAVRAGAQAVAGAATGTPPPATAVSTPPPLGEGQASARMPSARIDQLHSIIAATADSLPRRGNAAEVPPMRDPLNQPMPADQNGLVSRMYGIIDEAKKAGTMTQDQIYEYGQTQQALARQNPDLANRLSIAPTRTQSAFTEDRKSVYPDLASRAERLLGQSRGWLASMVGGPGPQTSTRRALNTMRDILQTASQADRSLNHRETARYLNAWEHLRQYEPTWADRMQLHTGSDAPLARPTSATPPTALGS